MKKKFSLILLILLCFFVFGCTKPITSETFTITIQYNNGDGNNEIVYNKGDYVVIDEEVEYKGYNFIGWFLDEEFTQPLPEDYKATADVTIYAKWDVIKQKVVYYVDEEVYLEQEVIYREYAIEPETPVKEGYTFQCWSIDKNGESIFNFEKRVTRDVNLYAQWTPTPFTVTYDLGYDGFSTKYDLYKAYFTDFYNFIIENTEANLTIYGIENLEDFLEFCYDWNANGKDSFYGVGDAFGKYYVTKDTGGVLENQPTSTFIGYCYQNELYLDFIPFLIQFFAYWRIDEGYATPTNHGSDFFHDAWASLVDTCKFFYFTSANLNDTYSWFKSERVKDALDNVPGVNSSNLVLIGDIENPVILKEVHRNGFKFIGWFDEEGNQITEVTKEMTVYARWQEK